MQMKVIIDAELVNVKKIAVRRWKSRSSSKVTASWEKRFYFFRRVVNVSVHIVLGKCSCCPHFRKYLGNWCSQCPKMTVHCSFSIKPFRNLGQINYDWCTKLYHYTDGTYRTTAVSTFPVLLQWRQRNLRPGSKNVFFFADAICFECWDLWELLVFQRKSEHDASNDLF